MIKNSVRAILVAAGVLASGAAMAGATSEWSYIGQFQQAGGLSSAFNNSGGLSASFGNAAGLSTRAQAQGASFTLDAAVANASAGSSTTPITFPSDTIASSAVLQGTLWSFVSDVRSQQTGNAFVAATQSASVMAFTLEGQIPTVPLPSPAWLLAAGAACLLVLQRRVVPGRTN
ncbi:MAG: hypothetical protein JO107_11335 [Hyphomicrobiales bacterium]|nr:hypothetical protein [Hyphomicrobiales bacterium]